MGESETKKGDSELDETEFTQILSALGQTILLKKSKNILVYTVGGIKIDFVNYPYAQVEFSKEIESIRLATMADISAMKLGIMKNKLREFI